MGEVYRARDTRLGRTVALKILPESLSADADRLARFEQEARSASALNHPHIVTVFDVGQWEGGPYIAMELVEGESLRDLLAEGPLPLRKALTLGAQLAEGLAKAHDAGIVHRDLKPENVMVSRDGFVKILDFGLAKLTQSLSEGLSREETAPGGPPTAAGTLVGTVGYMSPEQAGGRAVDFRSDQFSLGAILFELLTGKRAFARDTAVETLSAIIREEPPKIESYSPSTPEPVRWIAARCLAKDPDGRYTSTRDLARELAGLVERLSRGALEGADIGAAAARLRLASPLGIAAMALAALAAGAGSVWLLRRPETRVSASPRVLRYSLPAPPGAVVTFGEIHSSVVVSPDGKDVVIRAFSGGRERLFVRSLDGTETRLLEGAESGSSPVFSPDGRTLAFFAEGKLKKVPIAGGPPETICDARHEGDGTWSPSGDVLFAQIAPVPGIYRVSAAGGKPERITRPEEDRKGGIDLWPHFLPGGRSFLYVALTFPPSGAAVAHDLRIGSLDGQPFKKLTAVEGRAQYAAGFLLTVREGSLLAQRFDVENSRLEGTPQRVASEVHQHYGPGHAGFSVSPEVLVYQRREPDQRLVWFDRSGRELSELPTRAPVEGFRISPDGQRLALDIQNRRSGTSDIWIQDLARGAPTRLHFDPTDETRPVWFPDGRRIAYCSDRRGPPDIYTMDLGAPGEERGLLQLPAVELSLDVSPDGLWLAFEQDARVTGTDLWLLPLSGESAPRPFLKTPFDESDLRFSGDGKWVAYVSDESGRPEIYITPFDRSGEKIRVSTAGGRLPRWPRDGGELCWVAPGGELMAAAVRVSGAQVRIGAPTPLFRVETGIGQFDVSHDGGKFLVGTPLSKVAEPPIEVVVNWMAALEP
jgi:Tol biopolymer transport system component